jgi:hypothetical protein
MTTDQIYDAIRGMSEKRTPVQNVASGVADAIMAIAEVSGGDYDAALYTAYDAAMAIIANPEHMHTTAAEWERRLAEARNARRRKTK